MKEIATEDAAGRLADLIDEAARGEDVVLLRNGQPIARIVPVERKAADFDEVVRRMNERRSRVSLGPDLTIRQLIEEGRRY